MIVYLLVETRETVVNEDKSRKKHECSSICVVERVVCLHVSTFGRRNGELEEDKTNALV